MKVLIVDDMVESSSFVEDLLQHMGHDSVTAENGSLALELMAKEKFDLVISDILMPVMDGYQLCKAIKSDEKLSQIPVMLLSAVYLDDKDRELAEGFGAGMLVRKPIEAGKLMGLIDQMLNSLHGERRHLLPESGGETELLDLYNQRLVHQLETKMMELEREIKRRERKEKELMSSRQQLRELSAHLQKIQEKERMRLAREIHDELGQALTALRMEALLIRSKADSELINGKVHDMVDLIDITAAKVQHICAELRPSILDDLGLTAAADWLVDEFRKRCQNTEIRYLCSEEERDLPHEVNTATFRILQESLTNVFRHSQAENVAIDLDISGETLTLKIVDDGRGISGKEKEYPGSFGLLGMHERAHNVGGDLMISGEPGKGTGIMLTIPLKGRKYDHKSPDR